MIAAFGEKIRQALRDGDPSFPSAYVRLFVDRVVFSADAIQIFGAKSAIVRPAADGTGAHL